MPLIGLKAYREEMQDFARREVPEVVRRVRNELGDLIADGLVRSTPGTPVDTGEARGGWFVTEARGSRVSPPFLDPSGAQTVARMKAAIRRAKTPWLISAFRNTVEHISYLEEGRSTQAPAGMITPTLAAANTFFPAIVSKARREARGRRRR